MTVPQSTVRSIWIAAALCAPTLAQQPSLRVPATVPVFPTGVSSPLQVSLAAPPARPFALLADLGGGPRRVLGADILLDLSPSLVTVVGGSTRGVDTFVLSVPSGTPTGVPVYFQALVADPQLAPISGLAVSNGESTIPHDGRLHVIAERFDDPAAAGFTGDYDTARRGVLAGGPVRRRVHQTVDPQGVPFPQPIQNPLNPFGARTQIVYRPVDLGGDGSVEDIVAMRWRPLGPVVADRFVQMEIRIGHTPVVPDYTVDPFTALPAFPNSGLSTRFAANYDPVQAPFAVYRGAYDVRPADLTPRGYLPFPAFSRHFPWNGTDSLLVEVFVPPQGPGTTGANGASVRLMVQSSPDPNARVVAAGSSSAPVDPFLATSGRGDNALYDFEVEFLRVLTEAISPWLRTRPGADYVSVATARRNPAGSFHTIAFRGADDPSGSNATPWLPDINFADGHEFLQYRVVFRANPATAEVPELDSLTITWR
ncbi:MAG: hypothetical protein IPM29_02865 [Planctomycetes bacterium]|nr:hypothetical protein [Planctomycetota bacterium]